ncbi:hypothetical protein NMY22_g7670 [Coprinellus aureogranulatus]|nr:hypothetical protein NMY22_g7670 [Coprinellus aureogranulatus]
MDQVDNIQDLTRLSLASWHFHIALKLWFKSNAEKMMVKNGIQNPGRLVEALEDTNSIIAGPECLTVWYPSLPSTGRMEIFVPKPTNSDIPPIVSHLIKEQKFKVDKIPAVSQPHDLYQDQEFGRTVTQLITLTKRATKKDPSSGKCVVVVSKSPDTALITVTEMPTTLFMNCVTGSSVICLYPHFTFSEMGIMNYDGPVRHDILPPTQSLNGMGFTLITKLQEPLATSHICGQDHRCPYTVRNSMDGKAYWNDIFTPYNNQPKSKRRGNRFMLWRLRCAGMCGDQVPETDVMEALIIVYATQNFHYSKPSISKKDMQLTEF